ncbi:hypothetical protein BTH42_09410 [Burkholderia sp. SRS-W-2-2016]|nr:hypothetical protein BTH42_09410 [Burkholderia sp. SRS-W-2-2016]
MAGSVVARVPRIDMHRANDAPKRPALATSERCLSKSYAHARTPARRSERSHCIAKWKGRNITAW